jgi:hypothetical protein
LVAETRSVSDPLNEVTCTLAFPGGCGATLLYTTQGNPGLGKEWIEVNAGGHTWTIDDFRSTRRDGKTLLKGGQKKGHAEALQHFVDAALGRAIPESTAADGLRATQLALAAQRRLTSDTFAQS